MNIKTSFTTQRRRKIKLKYDKVMASAMKILIYSLSKTSAVLQNQRRCLMPASVAAKKNL